MCNPPDIELADKNVDPVFNPVDRKNILEEEKKENTQSKKLEINVLKGIDDYMFGDDEGIFFFCLMYKSAFIFFLLENQNIRKIPQMASWWIFGTTLKRNKNMSEYQNILFND